MVLRTRPSGRAVPSTRPRVEECLQPSRHQSPPSNRDDSLNHGASDGHSEPLRPVEFGQGTKEPGPRRCEVFSDPIVDLHVQVVDYGGLRLGGRDGSWRHKPRGPSLQGGLDFHGHDFYHGQEMSHGHERHS